jgi:hypothetical protein
MHNQRVTAQNYSQYLQLHYEAYLERVSISPCVIKLLHRYASAKAVERRALQLALLYNFDDIMQRSSASARSGALDIFFKKPFTTHKLHIYWYEGRVVIRFLFGMRLVAYFLLRWFENICGVIYAFCKSCFTSSLGSRSHLLVESLFAHSHLRDKKQQQLYEYFRAGNIQELHTGSIFAYGEGGACGSLDDLHISRRPDLQALSYYSFSLRDMFLFLYMHLLLLYKSIRIYIEGGVTLFLLKDIADLSVMRLCSRLGCFSNVYITNSSFNNQPLWFELIDKSFKTNLIWYSTNWRPLLFAKPFFENPLSVPSRKHMKLDNHFVWNKIQGEGLITLDPCTHYTVTGSILLYTHTHTHTAISMPHTDIVIGGFDITPMTSEKWESLLGFMVHYYSTDIILSFWYDLISVIGQLSLSQNASLLMKPKRKTDTFHCKNYLSQIEQLIATGKIISMDYDVNLYSYISQLDIVFCIPYTSPAYIAQELHIPAVFYDPTGELYHYIELPEGITFCSGRDELLNYLSAFTLQEKDVTEE